VFSGKNRLNKNGEGKNHWRQKRRAQDPEGGHELRETRMEHRLRETNTEEGEDKGKRRKATRMKKRERVKRQTVRQKV
jgi:hypothetical protein